MAVAAVAVVVVMLERGGGNADWGVMVVLVLVDCVTVVASRS